MLSSPDFTFGFSFQLINTRDHILSEKTVLLIPLQRAEIIDVLRISPIIFGHFRLFQES